MCGIMGVYSFADRNVAKDIFTGLKMIQHRGQDSAGIATYDGKRIHLHKETGLVEEALPEEKLELLKGRMGIGQVRYPTIGSGTVEDAQPFVTFHPYGIMIAHNGNIVNFHQLKEKIKNEHKRLVNSGCDIEAVLHLFAAYLDEEKSLSEESIINSVKKVYKEARGSYAVIGIIAGYGMFAFRDSKGIKPMIIGKNSDGYAISSESVSLDILGYDIVRDVKPGELVLIDEKGEIKFFELDNRGQKACIFEWVYFARPDSIMDNISVYEARFRLGKKLAEKIPEEVINDIDFVVPVPDTSRTAALAISQTLKIPMREGLIKNRYIGRTFIMPNQESRINAIRQKLNPIRSEIEGKNILLVDDSIVRGNTSEKIIKLLKENGVNKIYMGIYSAPIKHPCYYGIDMQREEELIANKKSIEEIKNHIGADGLFYQTIEDMVEAVRNGYDIDFCTGCFSKDYPVPPTKEEINSIKADRDSVDSV